MAVERHHRDNLGAAFAQNNSVAAEAVVQIESPGALSAYPFQTAIAAHRALNVSMVKNGSKEIRGNSPLGATYTGVTTEHGVLHLAMEEALPNLRRIKGSNGGV